MPDIPTPPLGPYTKIFQLSVDLYRISDRVVLWSRSIRNIWMVGKWFYDLGMYVENKVRDASYMLVDVDRGYRKVKRWVDGLIDGTTFEDILYWLSDNFRKIRNDPVAWVRGRMRAIGWEISQFIDDPYGWVLSKIRSLNWWFGWFLDSPRAFIINKLQVYSSWFNSFLINPKGKVRSWVESSFPFLADLWTNPGDTVVGWIAEWYGWIWGFLDTPLTWLDNRLLELSYPLWRFAHWPTSYVEEMVQNLLGINVYDMRNLWEWVLRKILANLTARRVEFESQIERTASEVISWFL